MGKGDRKSRRGKLWRGSHGKHRPKKKPQPVTESTKPRSRKKKSS